MTETREESYVRPLNSLLTEDLCMLSMCSWRSIAASGDTWRNHVVLVFRKNSTTAEPVKANVKDDALAKTYLYC